MTDELRMHACSDIGTAGTSEIFFRQTSDGIYIARMGIAIMGATNYPEQEGMDPFDPNFHDNYVEGRGITKEAAVSAMKRNQSSISNSLWY